MKRYLFLTVFILFSHLSIYSLDYNLRRYFKRNIDICSRYVSKDFFEEKIYQASPVSVGMLSGLLTNNGKSICLMHYLFVFLLNNKAVNDDSLSIPIGYCLGLLIGQASKQTIQDVFDRYMQCVACSKAQIDLSQNGDEHNEIN